MKPKEVEEIDIAFGKVDGLMPKQHSIPEEFTDPNSNNKWVKWQSDWFFNGLQSYPKPKKGIDLDKAMRHLSAIQKSFKPKHEHKSSAVAYLASQWFEKP